MLDFAVQLNQQGGEAAAAGGLMAMLAGMFVVMGIIWLAIYVYTSFAFMAIGKKAKDSMYGLAWIPGLGPALISFRASGMHWWPWLLLVSILISWIPIIGQIIFGLCMLGFAVFTVIWMWKMFEKIQRPGWWAILMLIPLVNLVVMGIAAWGEAR